MNYEVFPFGKYKGVKLNELPSTYIVLALESFALPEELNGELGRILLGRLRVYTSLNNKIDECLAMCENETAAFYEMKSFIKQRQGCYEK